MCDFFSFVVTKTGDIFSFNREQRLKLKETNPDDSPDSHSFICSYYNLDEDKVNKYEYLKDLKKDNIVFDVNSGLKSKINYFVENLNLEELITNSYDAYLYCRDLKDRPEIRKLITDSNDAYLYCRYIKDRLEIRKLITNSNDAYLYCRDVKDRPEIRKLITTSNDAYWYCRDVKDRPEIRKLITY